MAPLLARMDPGESRKAALFEELAGRDTASGIDDLEFARTSSRREPFGSSRARGYRFTGIGTYGPVPGEPDSGGGGSNGIRTRA